MPPARLDGDGARHRRDCPPPGSSPRHDLPGGNRCVDGYRPESAARRAWARKLRGSKIQRSTRLCAHVEDRLAMGWFPEQIAGRMELKGLEHAVSAESIDRRAYSLAGRRAGCRASSRSARRSAAAGGGTAGASLQSRTGRQSISVLLHEVDGLSRQRRIGAASSGMGKAIWYTSAAILLTLQERRTRLTLARRLLKPRMPLFEAKDAAVAATAIAAELGGLPASARRTITHDNSREFARHKAVQDVIGLRAFFCDPHSLWQRGSIENANGRLRRDLPRKTSLGGYTHADIDDVIWNLNATSRKCLGYRTPIEAFAANLGVALEM